MGPLATEATPTPEPLLVNPLAFAHVDANCPSRALMAVALRDASTPLWNAVACEMFPDCAAMQFSTLRTLDPQHDDDREV